MNISTEEDTESDNAAASPGCRERKWTTSTDTSFTISDQKRLPPVGCSSDDLQSSSSNSSTNGGISTSLACYDSLEDLSTTNTKVSGQINCPAVFSPSLVSQDHSKRQRRSLPQIPIDFSRQQQRAFEIMANNFTMQNQQPNFWSPHGTGIFTPPEIPCNPNIFPFRRHVEGRCADQEYFGAVNDSHHHHSNFSSSNNNNDNIMLAGLENENNFSYQEHSSTQLQKEAQFQKKRQLPQIPSLDKFSQPTQFLDDSNIPETNIDIEADEILRYNVEKKLEPSDLKNSDTFDRNDQNEHTGTLTPAMSGEDFRSIANAGFVQGNSSNSGDDSGCASLELPKSIKPHDNSKVSKNSSNFLWFGIDVNESDASREETNKAKNVHRASKPISSSDRTRNNSEKRIFSQTNLKNSSLSKPTNLKLRASSFNGFSHKNSLVGNNNKHGKKNNIDKKKSTKNPILFSRHWSPDGSSVNIDTSHAEESLNSLPVQDKLKNPVMNTGDTIQIEHDSMCRVKFN